MTPWYIVQMISRIICTISVSLCYQAFAIAGSLTAVFTRLLWILSGFSHTHWPAGFSDYSKLLTKISNKFLKRVHQFLRVRFRSTWLFCPRRSVFAQWQNDCTDTWINVKNIVINVAEADKNGERFPCHFVIKRPLATLMLMLMKLQMWHFRILKVCRKYMRLCVDKMSQFWDLWYKTLSRCCN